MITRAETEIETQETAVQEGGNIYSGSDSKIRADYFCKRDF